MVHHPLLLIFPIVRVRHSPFALNHTLSTGETNNAQTNQFVQKPHRHAPPSLSLATAKAKADALYNGEYPYPRVCFVSWEQGQVQCCFHLGAILCRRAIVQQQHEQCSLGLVLAGADVSLVISSSNIWISLALSSLPGLSSSPSSTEKPQQKSSPSSGDAITVPFFL